MPTRGGGYSIEWYLMVLSAHEIFYFMGSFVKGLETPIKIT
jgi:hypothetical protein